MNKLAKTGAMQAVRQARGDEVSLKLGADKSYDVQDFIESLQEMKVLPQVAQNTSGRKSAVPDAMAASERYAISQLKRKRIEQAFGWARPWGTFAWFWCEDCRKSSRCSCSPWRLITLRNCARWDRCARKAPNEPPKG